MAFVVDASVTAAWFIESQAIAYTDRLLDRLTDEQVFVPAIWPAEFTNVLLVLERRGKLGSEQVRAILRLAAEYPITIDTQATPLTKLYRIGREYGLTAYDAAYLELALRLDLPLGAKDGALVKAVPRAGLTLE